MFFDLFVKSRRERELVDYFKSEYKNDWEFQVESYFSTRHKAKVDKHHKNNEALDSQGWYKTYIQFWDSLKFYQKDVTQKERQGI